MVLMGIEGNPFIIRFKTLLRMQICTVSLISIEGNPFIIRFKIPDINSLYTSE